MPFRLCIDAPRTPNQPRPSSPRRGGTAIRRSPLRNWPVIEPSVVRDRVRGALGDDLAAVLAGPRPHVDDPVRRAHHLLVVLDDEDRVAESRSRSSVAMSLPLSRWWSPIEGSSRM